MLSNVELYFRTGEYNLDIVDIIISASAKALNINIFIYQNDHGQIKVLKQNTGSSTAKDVYVKYSSDHYDSIVLLSREADQTNYLVVSNISADSAADTTDDDSQSTNLTTDDDSQDSTVQSKSAFSSIHEQSCSANEDTAEKVKCYKEINDIANEVAKNMGSGQEFPYNLFWEIEPERVDSIPEDINGLKVYKMKASKATYMKQARDKRHFYISTSTKKTFNGIRCLGKCSEYYVCPNADCPYVTTTRNRVTNTNLWNYVDKKKICHSCGTFAKKVPCPARKLLEFSTDTDVLTVYHFGTHVCKLGIYKDENGEEIEQEYQGREKLGPVDMRADSVLNDIEENNWSWATSKVCKMHNIKRINYVHSKAVRQQNTDCDSFEAVSIIKEGK